MAFGSQARPQQTSLHAVVCHCTTTFTRLAEENASLSDIVSSFSVLKPFLPSQAVPQVIANQSLTRPPMVCEKSPHLLVFFFFGQLIQKHCWAIFQ